MIFDTNILIYISKNILSVEDVIDSSIKPQISVISYIEALGFPFATEEEKFFMEQICASYQVVQLSEAVAAEIIRLRKNFKLKLPDAIIYATASVQNLPLLTNNIADFKNLGTKVELINPFDL